jgi:hypothetical protein
MRGRTVTGEASGRRLSARRWLGAAWWPLFPAFAALTARLGIERACGDPYDLLPALTSNPVWAWPMALAYVLAHAWLAVAYGRTALAAGTLAPGAAAWTAAWGRDRYKVGAMAAALVVEYAPMILWRTLGATLGCGPGA